MKVHKRSYLNVKKENIELCAKDEKFIKLGGIEGNEYYISNYGRLLSKVNSNGSKILKGSDKRLKGKILYRLSSYYLSIEGSYSFCIEKMADVLTAEHWQPAHIKQCTAGAMNKKVYDALLKRETGN